MKKFYTIYIEGKSAVKAGYAFQGNHCYRGILNHGKQIAQLEVVRDDDEAQLVSVAYIDAKNVGKVLKILSNVGFCGMVCDVEEEVEDGCFAESKCICAVRI